MREIKFRAWVKIPATVLPGESRMLQWDGMYGICRCDSKDGTTSVAVHVAIADQCYLLPDDIVLMQFTGLKDKNDKEIWEGDILSLDGGAGPVNAAVGYENGCFVIEAPWVKHEEHDWPELKYYIDMTFVGAIVIGNIYENPELIKVQP